ncbi:MAG: hypothetical protein PHZ00_01485 [Candidatus Peribacteraceae bacterium]|nr:hypothetical protein [Candidatus Peribacteraceae bacterium]
MHITLRRTFYALITLSLPCAVAAQAVTPSPDVPAPPLVRINQEQDVEVRGDFILSPTRIVMELDPGEEETVELQIISREGIQRSFDVTVEDFSITDDGTDNIQFYAGSDGPFSARSWVTPAVPAVTIEHGQRAFFTVKVSVPKNASVGDHYSVVLFQRQPGEDERGGVSMVSRVGALFLITVKGDVVREGSLQQFLVQRRLNWALPVGFALQYRNTGTVHVVPQGHMEIRNIFGVVVDDIAVKDWYVLRDSTRRREIVWQPKFAFGYYNANLILTAAGQQQAVSPVSFWVIPAIPTALILIAIFAVSFLVQAFFSRFELKKKKKETPKKKVSS